VAAEVEQVAPQELVIPDPRFRRNYQVDRDQLASLFKEYDSNNSGTIGLNELETMLYKLGVAPLKDPMKRGSASSDNKERTA
jgi:Ca2+-binding EF-hand superfamily protein